ncbi:hypothetical protein ACFL56_02725 [Candidatus Margulisiibacteriota bacterium]
MYTIFIPTTYKDYKCIRKSCKKFSEYIIDLYKKEKDFDKVAKLTSIFRDEEGYYYNYPHKDGVFINFDPKGFELEKYSEHLFKLSKKGLVNEIEVYPDKDVILFEEECDRDISKEKEINLHYIQFWDTLDYLLKENNSDIHTVASLLQMHKFDDTWYFINISVNDKFWLHKDYDYRKTEQDYFITLKEE